MRFFLITTLALLSYTCGAPTDFDSSTSRDADMVTPTNFNEDDSKQSDPLVDLNNQPLPSTISLPESDKKSLCKFLHSFQFIRMELLTLIWSANLQFISDAEKYFTEEFKDHMNQTRNATSGQENFGLDQAQANLVLQNETAFEEYAKENVVQANILKMMNSIYKGFIVINKHLQDDANKMKSNLSKETVQSEHEFLVLFENMKAPTETYHTEIGDLLNNVEMRYNHRYQCS